MSKLNLAHMNIAELQDVANHLYDLILMFEEQPYTAKSNDALVGEIKSLLPTLAEDMKNVEDVINDYSESFVD